MCGIAGFIDKTLSNDQAESVASKMTGVLTHRGPDGSGKWTDNRGLYFVHRRLAILDLNPTGHQPMVNVESGSALTFNGEIYNYLELKNELRNEGQIFKGSSDTEVLLYALERWGVEKTLSRSKGMFAFAFYSRNENHLYLARDRMGEKPLYFSKAGESFAFASELKAIMQMPSFKKEINEEALSSYFQLNYVPAPQSIFKNCFKIEAASFLKIDLSSMVMTKKKYWTYPEYQGDLNLTSDDEALQAFVNAFSESIKGQLHSDVPLGSFLSGGLDSTAVTLMMSRMAPNRIKTFTIGFSDSEFDESRFAKKIAEHIGSEHQDWILSPKTALEIVPLIPEIYDEPFSDSSQLPTALLSKVTSQKVKVVLSGDGGDELLGGYIRYLWTDEIWQFLDRIPVWMRKILGKTIGLGSDTAWTNLFNLAKPALPLRYRVNNFGTKLKKLELSLMAASPQEIYRSTLLHWDPSPLSREASRFTLNMPVSQNFMSDMMRYDSLNYLPDDIMVKVDRASMAFSLETRAPFLDHQLIEFCQHLPMKYKVRNGQSKWLLRQYLQKNIPKELFERPKQGFAIPISDWLKTDLRAWAEDLLSESSLNKHGLLNNTLIRQCWASHLKAEVNAGYKLWDVLVFQSWYKKWMET